MAAGDYVPLALAVVLAAVAAVILVNALTPDPAPGYKAAGVSIPWGVWAVGAALLLVGLGVGGYVGWRRLEVWAAGMDVDKRANELHIERMEHNLQQHKIDNARQIWPDFDGQFPILWDGTRALDPNRGIAFSLDGVRDFVPEIVRGEQIARMLRAGRGWPYSEQGESMLKAPAVDLGWPSRVPLRALLNGGPSYKRLALGVTLWQDEETGQIHKDVVTADMESLVHVAVGGSSGWGKSVFLRALAFQLAKSAEPVDLAMIDLEGATFAPFAQSGRLLWPIADDESGALAIFGELTGELDRRKELFAEYPGVDSLSAYNMRAAEPLPPLVCLVDEATALLGDKGVEGALRTLALRARKYGLWLILAGQDWKATSLDTAIRNQLGARVQFKAMSPSQSRILLQQAGAEELPAKGRALAWLPGRDLTELQAPWVSRTDILEALTGGGPRLEMPETPAKLSNGRGVDPDKAAQVLELKTRGESDTAIARQVFGYGNPFYINKVRQVLNDNNNAAA